MMRRFLILDDEANVLQALRRSLRRLIQDAGLEIEIFSEPQLALDRLGQQEFDLVLSDFMMPHMNGIDFLRVVKELQPDAVRLMLTASSDFKTVMDAVNEAEVFRYLNKPWNDLELMDVIQLALTRRAALLDDRHLADAARLAQSTPQERETRRLELDEPGVTRVEWGPDGSVRLE